MFTCICPACTLMAIHAFSQSDRETMPHKKPGSAKTAASAGVFLGTFLGSLGRYAVFPARGTPRWQVMQPNLVFHTAGTQDNSAQPYKVVQKTIQ